MCRRQGRGPGRLFQDLETDLLVLDIFQFEYSLVKDPKRGGVGAKSYRINYDVSLLDCAKADGVTDVPGTGVQPAEKVGK
jgi:hypothetical protein